MNAEKIIGIYGLQDPRTGVIRYVGQSKDVKRRYQGHINDARCSSKNYPVNRWFRKLINNGLIPNLIIIEESPLDINASEIYWISHYKLTVNGLLNVADGGVHIPMSANQRVSNGFSGTESRMKNHAKNPKAKRLWKLKHMLANTYWTALKKKRYYLAYHAKFRMKLLAALHPDKFGEWSVL